MYLVEPYPQVRKPCVVEGMRNWEASPRVRYADDRVIGTFEITLEALRYHMSPRRTEVGNTDDMFVKEDIGSVKGRELRPPGGAKVSQVGVGVQRFCPP